MSCGRDHASEFLRILAEVSALDHQLTLAVVLGQEKYATLIQPRELSANLRLILGRMRPGQPIDRFLIALTYDTDPDEALAMLSAEAAEHRLMASAATPQLLELLLSFIEAAGLGPSPAPSVDARYLKRSAHWLARLCVRVLPVRDRSRYLAEFTTDMATLPRREQLRYAIRTAVRILPLRQALRRSRQRVPVRRG